MVNERRWLALVFGLYFVLALGYSLIMPIWEGPDEPAHYQLAWHLTTYGEYATPEVSYETHQPRPYYYMTSAILHALNSIDPELTRYRRPKEYPFTIRKPERRFDWNDRNYFFFWGAYILRWVNIVVGGLALLLNWKTFKQIAPARPALCLAALALVALMPQYLHIMAAVNNDAPATLAGALLFYLAVRSLRTPSLPLRLFTMLLAVVLPPLTKLTVLPVGLGVLLALSWAWLTGNRDRRWFLYFGLALLAGAAIAFVLFPETLQTLRHQLEWRLFHVRENAFTARYIKFITSQIVWTYWAKVGWLAVGLPFSFIVGLTGLGLAGMALHLARWLRSKITHPDFQIWLVTWLIAGLTVLAVARNALTTRATQGRLLFPAVAALSLLMVAGWYDVLPSRVQQLLPLFIVLVFLAGNLILWVTGIFPVYYQPIFD